MSARVPDAPPQRASTFAIIDGTMVVGIAQGNVPDGVPVPEALEATPMSRLRFFPERKGQAARLMDVGTHERTFYVDGAGRLQALQLDRAWPAVRATTESVVRYIDRRWRVLTDAEVLAESKETILRKMDRVVMARSAPTALQAVHAAKAEEARAFLQGGVGPFPLLETSALAAGRPVAEEADKVVAAHAAERSAMSEAEGRRLRAKRAVREAGTLTAALEACAAYLAGN